MQETIKYWFLENFDFSKKLGKKNLMNLSKQLEMKTFRTGENINYRKANDNRVFFLKKGSVKIVNTETEHVKSVVNKGSIFGVLSDEITDDVVTNEHAICIEDCIICYISSNKMEALLHEYTSLKNFIIKIQSLKIRRLENKLEDLIYKTSEQRIKDFIVKYVHEYGTTNNDKLTARNLLNQKDLANLTSTSRQTVNNVISALRKSDNLEYSRTVISLPL